MTNLLCLVLGAFLLLSLVSTDSIPVSLELDSQQQSNLMKILRLCWGLRENTQFLDSKFSVSVPIFQEKQDFDPEPFAPYLSSFIASKRIAFSIPHPDEVNVNRRNELVHQVYYDRNRFLTSLRQPKIEYFVASSGLTTAHLATLHDHTEGMQTILEAFPDFSQISFKSSGTTPLHFAVLNRAYSCIRILLESGASPFTADNVGNTPLDLVFATGDINALVLFMVHGKILSHPALKQSSGVALVSGLLSLCAKLVLSGAESSFHSQNGGNLLRLLLLKFRHFDDFKKLMTVYPSNLPNTPLIMFVIREGINEAIELFSPSELVKPIDETKTSLLGYAFQVNNLAAFKKLTKLVPEFSNLDSYSLDVISIAYRAVQNGNTEFLKAMFTMFPTLHPWSQFRGVSLHAHALLNLKFEVSAMMVNIFKADIKRCSVNGVPIHEHALMMHKHRLFAYLISIGLNPNCLMTTGMTALNFAIKTMDVPLTALILSHRPNLMQPDAFGVTPMMLFMTSPSPHIRALIC